MKHIRPNKGKALASILLVFVLLLGLFPPLRPADAAPADYPPPSGTTAIVPGTFYYGGGGYSYGVTGTLSDGSSFGRGTFCTNNDFGAGDKTALVYYWNGNPGEDAASNPLFWNNVLGKGGSEKTGISMTTEQWRDLRYLVLLSRANNWSQGQLTYWLYLGHYMPEKYSAATGLASGFGMTWTDDLQQYFGAKGTSDFNGLGPVLQGDTLSLGAEADVIFKYSPDGGTTWNDITSAASAGSFTQDGGTDTATRVGPFRVEWKPGSNAALAQLNSGLDRETPPLFRLGSAYPADSNRVRFYKDSTTVVPTTQVEISESFYIEYNVTYANLQAAWNVAGSHTINVPVTATPKGSIIGKIIADEFFISPSKSQNQVNVLTENRSPVYYIGLKFQSTKNPGLTEESAGDIVYERPTVDKVVAEDNRFDNAGDYVDVLPVQIGTDVIHQMTITSNDPKGTILTFQNRDYDLFPSKLDLRQPNNMPETPDTTALVYNAAQFKLAISENKDIKLMQDIELPQAWDPAAAPAEPIDGYTGIFDGNGYRLIGTTGMTNPVFSKTYNAVFYRVQFVDFSISRSGSDSGGYGTLVDTFGSSTADGSNGELLDCFIQGSLLVNATTGPSSTDIGGVAGAVNAKSVYGVKAQIDLRVDNVPNLNNSRQGGLFGTVRTNSLENCEVLKGSKLVTRADWVGGLVCALARNPGSSSSETISVRNCKVDVSLENKYSTRSSRAVGGLITRAEDGYLAVIDRCIVNINYNPANMSLGRFGGILGYLLSLRQDATISNCDVRFYYDPSVDGTDEQETVVQVIHSGNVNSGGGGIINFAPDAGVQPNDIEANVIVKNCSTHVPMQIVDGNASAAGIINYSPQGLSTPPSKLGIIVRDSVATGNISVNTGSGNAMVIGGIAVTRPTNSGMDISVNIERSVAAMHIDAGGDTMQVGGIFSSPGITSNTVEITNSVFVGTMTDIGPATAGQIYSTDATVTAANNYTFNDNAGYPFDVDGGADGLTATPTNLASATDFYRSTLGFSSTEWSLTEPSPGLRYVPRLTTLYRWPEQRIYVNDYYNAKNSQEFIERLYVFEGGAFKHLWESSLRLETDSSTYVDIKMAGSTFVFYYFKPANDYGGDENDGANKAGAWQNQVKITPRDNYLVKDSTGNYHFDSWSGADDDDWVLAEDKPVDVKLNIVKMTSVDGNPSPLSGTTFTLYKSASIYSDFTGVDYTAVGWTIAGTAQPDGYTGANFVNSVGADVLIKPGSYIVRETVAPANYSSTENLARIWYLVFSGGELSMYLDDMALHEDSRVQLSESRSVGTTDTLTYSATIGNKLKTDVLARIRVVKYNEDGTQIIEGRDVPIDSAHSEYGTRFTGAIYGLRKYEEDSFELTSGAPGFGGEDGINNKFVYGGNIICGSTGIYSMSEVNYSDVEPGYYELAELSAPDGYVSDPTPFYFKVEEVGNKAVVTFVRDGHAANVDQVGYLAGVQDLTATVDVIDNSGSIPTLTIRTKDKKPEYKLTFKKYDGGSISKAALGGVIFDVYKANGTKFGSFATNTSGITGVITFPQENAVYTVKEVLPAGLTYTPSNDYTVEARDGALYFKGGAYNYDFKVVQGDRDISSYVILQPDQSAIAVYPDEDGYPADVTVNDNGIIGLVSAQAGVPNYRGTSVSIGGTKAVSGSGAPSNAAFTFTLTQVDADGNPATTPGIVLPSAAVTGAGAFTFAPIYGFTTPGTYYFKVQESNSGASGWSYDTTARIVTVTVEGSPLTSSAAYTTGSSTFTNTYTPSGGGGGGGGGDTPSPSPSNTPSETPPVTTSPSETPPETTPETTPTEPRTVPQPPAPPPGSTLVPGENGTYVELGDDGIPLGEWHWDPELEDWVFEEYEPPLASFPATGDSGVLSWLCTLAAAAGLFVVLKTSKKKVKYRGR